MPSPVDRKIANASNFIPIAHNSNFKKYKKRSFLDLGFS
jgi:hypothetical protein